ncbi:Anaerobic selenate reductase molybdenum cofactor-containing periplasmic protein / YnfE [Salmonella enterica subsp. diarizonae]|uniref:Anaerobic selenate reductase molybdenum cofactor-containing periplasmic protein / YnfE n=1 Tax=Salmonella diarizonae TaxID=59204 RepID=A0A379TYW1_SALDZ|nr:Anaerobic selenate reductase molybdenum cofactor-containing periplasmic protein / YnfE [Salmonella enterica subsp. diarizonae]
MPGEKQQTGVSRRTLVKSAALGSLALAAGGVSLPFGMRTAAAAVQQAVRDEKDKIVWAPVLSTAAVAAPCVLHVKDNEVWWVETDNTGDDVYGNHQVRACLRGRSIRRRINHPDRLNYPMNALVAVAKVNLNALAGRKRWTPLAPG